MTRSQAALTTAKWAEAKDAPGFAETFAPAARDLQDGPGGPSGLPVAGDTQANPRLSVREGEGFARVHGLVEATKRAFAWRNARLGDPAAMAARGADPRAFLQAAVSAPRWLPGRTWGENSTSLKLESRVDPALLAALRAHGSFAGL